MDRRSKERNGTVGRTSVPSAFAFLFRVNIDWKRNAVVSLLRFFEGRIRAVAGSWLL